MPITSSESSRKYYLKHKEESKQRQYRWRKEKKEKYMAVVKRATAKWNKKNPITFFFSRKVRNIRNRCNNPNRKEYDNYGGRGIKCLLSWQDVKFLWERDKADLMVRPTLHRLDNDGNYVVENCEYIEWAEHRKINHKRFDTDLKSK